MPFLDKNTIGRGQKRIQKRNYSRIFSFGGNSYNKNTRISNIILMFLMFGVVLSITACSVKKYADPVLGTAAYIAMEKTNNEYWPTNGWETSKPEEQEVDSNKINDMISKIKKENLPIDSIVIVRNGYIISETYLNSGINTRHEVYSVTKSFTSALVGIAKDEGYIKSLDDKVIDYFTDRNIKNVDGNKKSMTIRSLLTMSAGLDWDTDASRTCDTYKTFETDDPVQYFLDLPVVHEPGKIFLYNNGASHMLTSIVKKTVGGDLQTYVDSKLFKPMGITYYYWDKDRKGCLWGMSELSLTARDMAKFGYLYLNRGKWEGKQIVPEGWVDESTKKQITTDDPNIVGYGYQWWITGFGGYCASGMHGQYIFVNPELNLVAVFQSSFTDQREKIPLDYMVEYIIPSVTHKVN